MSDFNEEIKEETSALKNTENPNQELLDAIPNLSAQVKDNNLYGERERRNRLVTDILEKYRDSFRNKVNSSLLFRWILLVVTLIIMVCLSGCFIWYSFRIMYMQTEMKTTQFASFASASVTMLGTVFGLLTIITNYFFPKDDEKYLSDIVKAVQENDFRLGHDK